LIIIAILGFLIFGSKNSDTSKIPESATTQATYPSTSTTTNPANPVEQSKYASIYVSSTSRAVGYSINNSSIEQANANAKNQCLNQIKGNPNEECLILASGEGKCLAISRSSNGALGANISDIPISAAEDAQNACKSYGGKNCPWPGETTFCAD
jgi:hypothetical protein